MEMDAFITLDSFSKALGKNVISGFSDYPRHSRTTVFIERELVCEGVNFLADSFQRGSVFEIVEGFGDPVANAPHFRLFHSSRGDGRCADANAACDHGRVDVERDG